LKNAVAELAELAPIVQGQATYVLAVCVPPIVVPFLATTVFAPDRMIAI
jgi:hypothetical protein